MIRLLMNMEWLQLKTFSIDSFCVATMKTSLKIFLNIWTLHSWLVFKRFWYWINKLLEKTCWYLYRHVLHGLISFTNKFGMTKELVNKSAPTGGPTCRNVLWSHTTEPSFQWNAHQSKYKLSIHRGQEQEGGLTNYTKRSDTVRVAGATPLTTPHVWTNHRIRVLWKNKFS